MTQDYKDNVLQYATGILEQQTGINEPQFEDILATQNDLKTELSQYFSSMVVYTAFVPSKSVQNNDLGYSVLACYGTLVGQSDESGALVILDENYDIVKFMPTYSDGILMGVIKCLNVDNQGNFYGIEYSNNSYKIMALNNIVLKRANQSDYEAVQTVVMNIPNQYTWDDMIKIQRDDTGNRYFILGRRDVSGTTSLVGIHVEISDQVSWTFYTTTYDMQPVFGIFNQGFNVYWDSNNALHYSIAVDNSGLVLLTEQNSNVMKATRYSNEPVPSSYSNFVFRTNEIGYYATVLDMDTYTEFKMYQINLLTNQVTQIYGEDTTYDSRNQLWFFKNNNDIMYYQVVKTNNANEYELNVGLIDDLTIYSTQLGTFTATSAFEAFSAFF